MPNEPFKPPKLKLPSSPLDPLRDMIREGRAMIEGAGSDIRSLADELHAGIPGITITTIQEPEKAPRIEPQGATSRTDQSPSESVSNQDTLKYQLDLILDDLQHLETEHLPAKGRISGAACDCIAKAGRSLRRHANETIPIAARQGQDAEIFSELAGWAQHLMDIGTLNQVKTGKYDAEFLKGAGIASNYRKKVEAMFTSLGGTGDCPTCSEVKEKLSEFIEQRKRERAKG